MARGTTKMRSKHAAKILLSVVLVALSASSHADQRFVAGPLEAINSSTGALKVLGQTLKFDKRTPLTVDGKATLLVKTANLVPVGSFVLVEVTESASGLLVASAAVSLKSQYVPGSTHVAVAGVISGISLANGTIRIGDLTVDVTTIPPQLVSLLGVGTFVSVEGIQPARGGPVVSVVGFSIGGSGVSSIGGSGVQSIGGSGVSSIGGSGVSSIGGSGVQSIGGSGKQSIGGSGVQSIGGSGAN